MKRYLLLPLTALVACASTPAQVAPAAPALPPPAPKPAPYAIPKRSQDLAIAVTPGGVTLNGAHVPIKPTVADVEKLLGPADRVNDKPANILHTWDRLGIILYEPHDGRAGTIGLVYVPQGRDFDPAVGFTGRMSLDGLPLDVGMPFRSVLSYPGHNGGSSGDSTTFKYDSIEVYVAADAIDAPVRVVEVSFYNEADTDTPPPGVDERAQWQDALTACQASDGARCTALGMRYQHGTRHVRRNDPRAATLFDQGCEKRHAFACTALGVMHANGRAVPASSIRAARLFRTACSLGDTVACALKWP